MTIQSPAFRRLGLTLVILSCFSFCGCGKKTTPRPFRHVAPPQVQDLRAQVESDRVKLMWSAPPIGPGEKRRPFCYSIQRAKLPLSQEDRDAGSPDCPECPPLSQRELQCIDPAYPETALVKENLVTWFDETVTKGETYRYQVGTRDEKGQVVNWSSPVAVTVIPPPPAPESLTAMPESEGVLLQWEAPEYPHQPLRFLVERRVGEGDWKAISPVPIEETQFLDSVVTPDETYDYRVVSVPASNRSSATGGSAEVTGVKAPFVESSLPPPHTVWVVPAKEGALEVRWTEVQNEVKGYHVYRRSGSDITRLTAQPVSRPPFVDRTVRPNTVYFYAVSVVSPNPPYNEGLASEWVEIKSHVLQ